jgi:cytochrome b6-f complex iron-sulfur subunit
MPAQSEADAAKQPAAAVSPSPSRRGVLEWLLGGVLVVTGATFVGPLLSYLGPQKKKKGSDTLVGADGRPIAYDRLTKEPVLTGLGVDGEPTIVVRYAGETRAFSAVCTHLGCLVKWEAAKSQFLCPCHMGHFDANGINVSGPPPSPLKRFRVYATGDGHIGLEEIKA